MRYRAQVTCLVALLGVVIWTNLAISDLVEMDETNIEASIFWRGVPSDKLNAPKYFEDRIFTSAIPAAMNTINWSIEFILSDSALRARVDTVIGKTDGASNIDLKTDTVAACPSGKDASYSSGRTEFVLRSDLPDAGKAIRLRPPEGTDVRGYRPHPLPRPANIDWPAYAKSEKARDGCEYIALNILTPSHMFMLGMPGVGDGADNFSKTTFRLNALVATTRLLPPSAQHPESQKMTVLDMSADMPANIARSFNVLGSTSFRLRRLFLVEDPRHKAINVTAIGCDPEFRSYGKSGGAVTFPCGVKATVAKSRLLLQMSLPISCDLDASDCTNHLMSQLDTVDQWLAAAFIDD
jgi:hypothetical protein